LSCSLDLLPSLALDTGTLPITVPVVLLRKPAEPIPRPEELRTLAGHAAEVRALAFSEDGTTLVSSAIDGTIRVWEVASGKGLHVLPGSHPSDLAFHPDGTTLAATRPREVDLWDM